MGHWALGMGHGAWGMGHWQLSVIFYKENAENP
jgi:hypothetical protein